MMRKSAIMVLLDEYRLETDRLRALMMVRSEGKLNAGQVCFPGGKCDWIEEIVKTEDDYSTTMPREIKIVEGRWETYEEAAARECAEETGYKPYLFGELPSMPYYADGKFIGKVFVTTIQDCKLESRIEYPNSEHSSCEWCYIDDLVKDMQSNEIYGPITKAIIKILHQQWQQ